jgi:hypothetical protein
MRAEIEQIDGDREALAFALGCLRAGLCSAVIEPFSFSAGDDDMTNGLHRAFREPRTIGLASAIAATLLGAFYLVAAGAPARYAVVNLAALLLGLVGLGALDKAGLAAGRASGRAALVLGGALLATALLGASAEGASRWIWVGPLSVQVSLVVLPFMIVCFARRRDPAGAAGMALAALALALQPDRAMAGMLVLALAATAASRRDLWSMSGLLAAAAAFAFTLARPDALPAVRFVDSVVFTSFAVSKPAGAAVLLGLVLLVLPAIAGRSKAPGDGAAALGFGAVWTGILAAAVLGNYPTPVVGYGGSAILGYVLSLAAFAPRAAAGRPGLADRAEDGAGAGDRLQRSAALALSR